MRLCFFFYLFSAIENLEIVNNFEFMFSCTVHLLSLDLYEEAMISSILGRCMTKSSVLYFRWISNALYP
jgi:hypothetical protein